MKTESADHVARPIRLCIVSQFYSLSGYPGPPEPAVDGGSPATVTGPGHGISVGSDVFPAPTSRRPDFFGLDGTSEDGPSEEARRQEEDRLSFNVSRSRGNEQSTDDSIRQTASSPHPRTPEQHLFAPRPSGPQNVAQGSPPKRNAGHPREPSALKLKDTIQAPFGESIKEDEGSTLTDTPSRGLHSRFAHILLPCKKDNIHGTDGFKPRFAECRISNGQDNGSPSMQNVYFANEIRCGDTNSYSLLEFDFGRYSQAAIKLIVGVSKDSKATFVRDTNRNTEHNPNIEVSITFVPGYMAVCSTESPRQCFVANAIHYSKPESLVESNRRLYASRDTRCPSSSHEDNPVHTIKSPWTDTFYDRMKADDDETALKQHLRDTLADSIQMQDQGGQDTTLTALDTSKKTEIRPHHMSTTHMLRWKAQALKISNLDHPHIQQILQSPNGAGYPPITVRNLKFLQYVSTCIENDQIVPLSLLWSSHQPKYAGKLDSYYQNAIRPLLNQITNGWMALYPYLKGYEEMEFIPHEIETDQHAVADLLSTTSRCDRGNELQAGGIYRFKKFRKFDNLIQYQILMSVGAKRTSEIFEDIYGEDAASAPVCWIVNLPKTNSEPDTAYNSQHLNAGHNLGTDGTDRYHLYVLPNDTDRAAMKQHPVDHGQEFEIRFETSLDGENGAPTTEIWRGFRTEPPPEGGAGFVAISGAFVILAKRPRSNTVLTSYKGIIRAIRRDPKGTRVEVRVLSTPNPLSYMLIALQKLSSERCHTLSRVLIGKDENAPIRANDWYRYPVSCGKKLQNGGNAAELPSTQTAEDITAYDSWLQDLKTVNKHPEWHLDDDQQYAITLCTYQNLINLVEGPPATGKTRTLSASVHMAVKAGAIVLVIAANDTAVERLQNTIYRMRSDDLESGMRQKQSGIASHTSEQGCSRAVLRKTKILVTTCMDALDPQVSNAFEPVVIYIDDAQQYREFEVSSVILTYSSIKQINMFGDHVKTTYESPGSCLNSNEFSANEKYSMFERLKDIGVYCHQFKTQYRMTPHWAGLIKEVFYDKSYESILTSDEMKPSHKLTRAVINFNRTTMFKRKRKSDVQEVLLCNIAASCGYPDPESRSTINFGEANATGDIISRLLFREPDVRPEDIAVITYYSGQKWVLRERIAQKVKEYFGTKDVEENQIPDTTKIRLFSVESSLWEEFPIVFLNICNSGNDVPRLRSDGKATKWYPGKSLTAHVTNVNRLKGALSRHKYALYIICNAESLSKVLKYKYKNGHPLLELIETCKKNKWWWHGPMEWYQELDNEYVDGLNKQQQGKFAPEVDEGESEVEVDNGDDDTKANVD